MKNRDISEKTVYFLGAGASFASDFEALKSLLARLYDQCTRFFDSWMSRMEIAFEAEVGG